MQEIIFLKIRERLTPLLLKITKVTMMNLDYQKIRVIMRAVVFLLLKMPMNIMECMQVMVSHLIRVSHLVLRTKESMKSLISKNKLSMMALQKYAILTKT